MIKVNNISYAYNTKNVIQNISFNLKAGEILTILGPNGGGKTTLLKCLNNILMPKTGSVLINETNISKMSNQDIACLMALVPQKLETLFPFTVQETIAMGLYAKSKFLSKATQNKLIDHAIDKIGIAYLKNRYINELSGGEKQLVFVARAIIQDTPILLFDEATSNLDINHTATILRAVKSLAKDKNVTIIAIIHDINLAIRFSDKIMYLNGGDQSDTLSIDKAIKPKLISKFYNIDLKDIEFNQVSKTINVRL